LRLVINVETGTLEPTEQRVQSDWEGQEVLGPDGGHQMLDEEPARDTEPTRETRRSALCLLSPGRFGFCGILVDVDILVGAETERAVKEATREVGPDVVAALWLL
jgi:hypothetical protein